MNRCTNQCHISLQNCLISDLFTLSPKSTRMINVTQFRIPLLETSCFKGNQLLQRYHHIMHYSVLISTTQIQVHIFLQIKSHVKAIIYTRTATTTTYNNNTPICSSYTTKIPSKECAYLLNVCTYTTAYIACVYLLLFKT